MTINSTLVLAELASALRCWLSWFYCGNIYNSIWLMCFCIQLVLRQWRWTTSNVFASVVVTIVGLELYTPDT